MKIEQVLEKYNINEDILNKLMICMMDGKSLNETAKSLDNALSPEQVFAVGKFYCEFEFSLPIDEMSPRWAIDRIEIQEAKKEEIMKKIQISKELRKLKSIEEDLAFLEMEKKAKFA